MIRAFIDVFPGGVLLSGYGRELILLGRNAQNVVFDPDLVAARLAAHPDVRRDLESIDLDSLTDLVTTFAGSSERMNAMTYGLLALTDDSPILEYSQDKLPEAIIPTDLFGPDEIRGFCPKCVTRRPDMPHIASTVALLEALYRSDVYRVVSRTRAVPNRRFRVGGDPAEIRAAWTASRYLRKIIPESALPPLPSK